MAENNETSHPEVDVRRRILGFFLFPVAFFPLLALLSYDWREIPTLCIPPLRPSANLIGVAGDWFAYAGYQTFGLAIWMIPAICIFFGVLLIIGRGLNCWRRMLGVLVFMLAFTCLIQLTGGTPAVKGILHSLNIEPNAGGAIGYLVMTRGLTRVLSPFGSGVLMASLMLFSLLWTIGFRTLIQNVGRLLDWCLDRHELTPEEIAEKERKAAEEAAMREAARLAKEAAKAERLAEKERIAAEKQAERDAKEAEKEARRRERLEKAQNPPPRPATSKAPAAEPPATSSRQAPQPASPAQKEPQGPYVLPPLSLLNPPAGSTADHGDVNLMAQKLISTLDQFGIETTLAFTVPGPVVTQYALTPAPTVKVERIPALSGNLQMALEAKSLRIQAPIPGKNAVGIEVPNLKPCGVHFGDIARGAPWQAAMKKMHVPLLLGKDAAGNDLLADLAGLPHLLIAGATGQGKSVCLNSIINGFLMCRTPDELRLIMVDPKRVEFTQYNALPHLLVPIVNDTNKVVFALKWAQVEMERRLKMFSRLPGCKNIVDFNTRKKTVQPDLFGGEATAAGKDALPDKLPYIVLVIDEVADIIQTARKEVEPVVARLTALARATGIHLILATQRPDAKIITGVIKSNIPGRIAFKTSSSIDSRTILDDTGAEDLIGRGDMLYKTKEGVLLRAQGAWIQEDEIARVTGFIAEHASTQFDEAFAAKLGKVKETNAEDALDDNGGDGDTGGDEGGSRQPGGLDVENDDDIYNRALEVVRTTRRASTSHLQRRMKIGYNHAARLIDMLEERGVIGPARSAGPREILIDLDAMPIPSQADQGEESASAPPEQPPVV